jgi:serine/threonine protein kinase
VTDRYEVVNELGRGGTSVVYRARDKTMLRDVAMKVLLEENDSTAVKRLLREAQALSELRHPNIVSVYSLDVQDENKLTLVMDLVDGTSLSAMIKDKGKLTEEEAIPIFQQICAGLECAHQNGIVHRDLKPSNILVTADGVAQIVDFGLAKFSPQSGKNIQSLTQTGHIYGTPAYMSPEQLTGEVDQRSDIYSLGCLMYQTLSGKLPFEGESALEIAAKSLAQDPPSIPGISRKLQCIIEKAMRRDVDQRYQSASEIIRDLDDNLIPQPLKKHKSKAVNKKRAVAVAIACLAAVGIGALCFLFMTISEEREAKANAHAEWLRFIDEINPQGPNSAHVTVAGWQKYLPIADAVPDSDERKTKFYVFLSEQLLQYRHKNVLDLEPAIRRNVEVSTRYHQLNLANAPTYRARAYIALGRWLRKMGAPPEEQIKAFSEAMADPTHNSWYYDAARHLFGVYLSNSRVEDAIKLLNRVKQDKQDPTRVAEMFVVDQERTEESADTAIENVYKLAARLDELKMQKLAMTVRKRMEALAITPVIVDFTFTPLSRHK